MLQFERIPKSLVCSRLQAHARTSHAAGSSTLFRI